MANNIYPLWHCEDSAAYFLSVLSVSPNDGSQMGSIKVWRAEGCRPRLAVEDVLISLPTLRLSRKEGGKKWGTPGAYFYISGIRRLRQVSGEMSRDGGKGWRHHSGSFLNLRDKAGAITNAFSWPLIDDHLPLDTTQIWETFMSPKRKESVGWADFYKAE